jgi:putative ABC transport system substrate-binding protein
MTWRAAGAARSAMGAIPAMAAIAAIAAMAAMAAMAALGALFIATLSPVRAQALPRVGVLFVAAPAQPQNQTNLRWYEEGLRRHGLVRGRDYEFELRSAEGDLERLGAAADALAATRPAVMFSGGNLPVQALVNSVPADVPVVGIGGAALFTGNEAQHRPGGRATGMTVRQVALNGKRLEALAALCPAGGRVLHLGDPGSRGEAMPRMQALSRELRLVPLVAEAHGPADVDAAFARAARERACGVNVLDSTLFSAWHARMIALAREHRVAAIFQWPELAREGALLAYGPGRREMNLQAMGLVARVLRGEKPAEIPIEEPLRWQLAVNLREARALGLALPARLLVRADEVIE